MSIFFFFSFFNLFFKLSKLNNCNFTVTILLVKILYSNFLSIIYHGTFKCSKSIICCTVSQRVWRAAVHPMETKDLLVAVLLRDYLVYSSNLFCIIVKRKWCISSAL